MSLHAAEALILGTKPYSNTSLIVSALTGGQGKIRFVAKGARVPKSRTGVSLEPASLAHLEWFRRAGAELGTLRRCEGLRVFRRLWDDYEAMSAAARMLKTVDRAFGPDEGDEGAFRLLLAALEAVDGGGAPGGVEAVFSIMLLGAMGIAPALRYCAECDRAPGAEAAVLDIAEGELRCPRCPLTPARGVRLRAGAVATVAEALRLAPEELHTLQVVPALREEVLRAGEAFLAYHGGVRPHRRPGPARGAGAR